jgi:hypothetical protein
MTAPPSVALGSLLFSLVDPRRGHERDYNRWYERDHFYAGALTGPGVLAGRRFVATRALKTLRIPVPLPSDGPLRDPSRGSYLVLYGIQEGEHERFTDWAVDRVQALHRAGRMFAEREQVQTAFFRADGGVARDADGVPPALVLDHPYAGLVVAYFEAPEAGTSAELGRWLAESLWPAKLAASPIAQCRHFTPLPLPEGAPGDTPVEAGSKRRVLALCFLEADPRDIWARHFKRLAEEVTDAGRGRLLYAAPFLPTVPGTDRYSDELW